MTDTGSLEPSPEALAWQQRADAWAQQAESEQTRAVEPASRWSDAAAEGRPTFPADGVGWRTETAEWRATGALWRQTTEWRSTSGTHGWRSTTEAWQTGGNRDVVPPVTTPTEQPAIAGTAWPTPADGADDVTRPVAQGWQQQDDARSSWPQPVPGHQQAAGEQPWHQRPDPPDGAAPATGTPSWRTPAPTAPTWSPPPGNPSWNTPGSGTPPWVGAGPTTPGSNTPAWNAPDGTTPSWSASGPANPTGDPAASTPSWNASGPADPTRNPPTSATPSWNTPAATTPSWNSGGSANPSWNTPAATTPSWNAAASANPSWSTPGPATAPGTGPASTTPAWTASGPGATGNWQRGAIEGSATWTDAPDTGWQRAGGTDAPTSGWQSPSVETTGWQNPTDTGPRQRPSVETAGWQNPTDTGGRQRPYTETASWQSPTRADTGGWQRAPGAEAPGWARPDASTSPFPRDDGRHLVREDDRAAWRRDAELGNDFRQAGARRPEERASGGTGWTARSDADNWAGHTDTGNLPMFADPATPQPATWGARSQAPMPAPRPGYGGETGYGGPSAPGRHGTDPAYPAAGNRYADPNAAASAGFAPGGRPSGDRAARFADDDPGGPGGPLADPEDPRGAGPRFRRDQDGYATSPRNGQAVPASRPRYSEVPDDWREHTGTWESEPDTSKWVRDPDTGQWSRAEDDPRVRQWREENARRDGTQAAGRRELPAGPSRRQAEDDREPTDSGADAARRPGIGRAGVVPGGTVPDAARRGFADDARDAGRDRGYPTGAHGSAPGGGIPARGAPEDAWAGRSAAYQDPRDRADSWAGDQPGNAPRSGVPRNSPGSAIPSGGVAGVARSGGRYREAAYPDDGYDDPYRDDPYDDGRARGRGFVADAPRRRAAPEPEDEPLSPDVWRRDAPTSGSAYRRPASEARGYRRDDDFDDEDHTWPPRSSSRSWAEPGGRQQGERDDARGSAPYRGSGGGDWRRELAQQSDLTDGESRRYGTGDFVPFRSSGAASVPGGSNLSMTSTSLLVPAGEPAVRAQRAGGDLLVPSGSYERRPVGGGYPAGRRSATLDPDDEEGDQGSGGPLAAVGYTVIWYGVPVILFVFYVLVVNTGSQAHALSTLGRAAPQFLISLVLSMIVAVGLRWASSSWKAVSVGLAAAVVGGGLATVLSSAITGNSLS